MLTDFELERQQRIADNQRRMVEMGIKALATKLQPHAPVQPPSVGGSALVFLFSRQPIPVTGSLTPYTLPPTPYTLNRSSSYPHTLDRNPCPLRPESCNQDPEP